MVLSETHVCFCKQIFSMLHGNFRKSWSGGGLQSGNRIIRCSQHVDTKPPGEHSPRLHGRFTSGVNGATEQRCFSFRVLQASEF